MLFRPNRYFTLGNFIPSRTNQYARATGAWFIHARKPRPNTLLVTGPTGSGKSHLLHALANFAKQNEAIRSMACMDAQQFASEMKYGCFYRDLDAVLDRFAAEDLLAIDNVDQVTSCTCTPLIMTKKIDLIRQIIAPGENAHFSSADLQELTDKEVLILLVRFSQWRQAIKAESIERADRRRSERQA